MQAAHRCLRDEEIPKDLFPSKSKAGTVKPMSGPATYHGHGCLRESIKYWLMLNKKVNRIAIPQSFPD